MLPPTRNIPDGKRDGLSAKKDVLIDAAEIVGGLIFVTIAVALSDAGFHICSLLFGFLAVGCGLAIFAHHINKLGIKCVRTIFLSLLVLDFVLFAFLAWHTFTHEHQRTLSFYAPDAKPIEPENNPAQLQPLPSSLHMTDQPPEAITLNIAQNEKERQQPIEKTAADLKAYKEHYLTRIKPQQNVTTPRITVVANCQNQLDTALVNTVCLMANRSSFSTVDGLLKPEFVTDGLFDKAFNGEYDPLDALDLTNYCEIVALCKLSTTVSYRPAFQANVADGKLQIRLIRAGSWELISSKEYDASAAAFQPDNAIQLVHESIIKHLGTNTFPYNINKQ